jgi:hypothetical protein
MLKRDHPKRFACAAVYWTSVESKEGNFGEPA